VVEDTVMGMDLPYKVHAVVEREKVRDYLLSPSHPTGKGKAEFFTSMGFQREAWEVLADALRQMARNCSVTINMTSPHGQKYIVDGMLVTPSGQLPFIRTVWVVDAGGDRPRLVTAYPIAQEASQ
jgi:hypothetical protein